ncbi:uncharacterized protein BJX67DRAFT_379919 [Aspergillus lucknowensis]|uniref:Uncharacterized protein n=1 Tax=Aspergillus lucknowensis TaxID=176173 RepID=A0ABR4LVI3_9EURO
MSLQSSTRSLWTFFSHLSPFLALILLSLFLLPHQMATTAVPTAGFGVPPVIPSSVGFPQPSGQFGEPNWDADSDSHNTSDNGFHDSTSTGLIWDLTFFPDSVCLGEASTFSGTDSLSCQGASGLGFIASVSGCRVIIFDIEGCTEGHEVGEVNGDNDEEEEEVENEVNPGNGGGQTRKLRRGAGLGANSGVCAIPSRGNNENIEDDEDDEESERGNHLPNGGEGNDGNGNANEDGEIEIKAFLVICGV